MKTVAVLGGGIGGLAASYYLTKSAQVTKVVVLESSSRYGGWLCTTRRSDGAVFEHGPRGIRPAGTVGYNTLNMVEDLGLEREILPVTYSHVASKNRYLFVKGKLHKMPSGISGAIRTVPPFSRPLLLSAAMEMLVKKSKKDDESVYSFVSRRLGKELADIAMDGLCRGVFAGDCRKLSMRSCFPPLYNAEQNSGSIVLGMLLGSDLLLLAYSVILAAIACLPVLEEKSLLFCAPSGTSHVVRPGPLAQKSRNQSWAQWSLRKGMESLPEAIVDWLTQSEKVHLHRHATVKQLHLSGADWEIQLEDGTITADHIVSAMPAKALASVLPHSLQPLIQLLQDVSSVTVAVVNLEYKGSILPITGFGHLVPSSEDRGLLGVVYDSVPYPQHDSPIGVTTRLTVMMGGAWFEEVFGDPEEVSQEYLLAAASRAISSHLGISIAPTWSKVTVQRDCIPQYYLGHWERVESMRSYIRQRLLPLSLAGSSYDGVSVNDVIFSGRSAVEGLQRSAVS